MDDLLLHTIAQDMLDDGDCDFSLPDKPGEFDFSLPLQADSELPELETLTSGSRHSSVTQKAFFKGNVDTAQV